MTAKGISIVSPMRPFHGEIATVQRNAVHSWLLSSPNSEVILIDDEEQTTKNEKFGDRVRVISTVDRSRLGAPLLDSMLGEAAKYCTNSIIAYITADVLLPPNIESVCEKLEELFVGKEFFAVCARYDILSPQTFDLSIPNWFSEVKQSVERNGKFHGNSAADLWIYPKTLDLKSPPFPIGRCGTDNWAIWAMKTRGIPVVDLTADLLIVHQWHPKYAQKSPLFYQEQLECVNLWPNMPFDAMTCLDADFLLHDARLTAPRGLRGVHQRNRDSRLYRFLIGYYRRFRKPELYTAGARS